MECNFAIFPAPKYDPTNLFYYKEYLFFIPQKDSSNTTINIPCLYLPKQTNKNPPSPNFLIFFHGNAEDIFGAFAMAEALLKHIPMNIIIVEYPGYSAYNLPKSSETIRKDAEFIYDYIKYKFNVNDNNMFVFGRSIGTGPAIYLASKRKPSALFVVSAFSSIVEVAKHLVKVLGAIVYDAFPSINNVKNITCPILFIHGLKDPLIPVEETIKLKNACVCPVEVVLPPDMTHNDFNLKENIAIPIQNFLRKHCVIEEMKPNFIINNKLLELPPEIENEIKKMKQNAYGSKI